MGRHAVLNQQQQQRGDTEAHDQRTILEVTGPCRSARLGGTPEPVGGEHSCDRNQDADEDHRCSPTEPGGEEWNQSRGDRRSGRDSHLFDGHRPRSEPAGRPRDDPDVRRRRDRAVEESDDEEDDEHGGVRGRAAEER